MLWAACGGDGSTTRHGQDAGKGGSGDTAGMSAAGSGAGSGSAGMNESGSGGAAALPPFDAGDPSLNAVKPADLCERLSTIQCAGEQHCCTSPGRTVEQCKTTMKDGCVSQLHLDEIAAEPHTGFDMTRAMSAFNEFQRLASSCDPTIATWGVSLDGLRGIMQGTLAPGASCMPAVNDLNNPVKAGAAAASCTMLATHACLPTPFKWTCDPRAGEGGDCFTDFNCQEGFYCHNPNTQFGAKCHARKATGTACVNKNECESLACRGGTCVEGVQAAYCLQ